MTDSMEEVALTMAIVPITICLQSELCNSKESLSQVTANIHRNYPAFGRRRVIRRTHRYLLVKTQRKIGKHR